MLIIKSYIPKLYTEPSFIPTINPIDIITNKKS